MAAREGGQGMNRRILACLVLGLSSGLPLNLTQKTLQAWMSSEHVDLRTIGLFSLASLPYSLKFLWAPFLDRFCPPWLGRRRGWILAAQVLIALAVAALSCCDPRTGLQAVAVVCVLVAFLSSSQDIAIDAWRVDTLPEREVGTGTALHVLGYRLSLLVTGSLALLLADRISWHYVYLGLGGLQLLLVAGTLFAPEPEVVQTPPRTLTESVIEPFRAFVAHRGLSGALSVLLFVALFKWGVYLVSAMSTPFLLSLGFHQSDVGTVLGGAGLLATIAGTAAGAAAMAWLPLGGALGLFGIAQAICGLLFWHLSHMGMHYGWMTAAVVSENFFIGMGTAALVAFITRACQARFSATQFALLSSLMAASRDPLTAPSGFVARAVGWPHFFLLTLAASIPGLLLLPLALRALRREDNS